MVSITQMYEINDTVINLSDCVDITDFGAQTFINTVGVNPSNFSQSIDGGYRYYDNFWSTAAVSRPSINISCGFPVFDGYFIFKSNQLDIKIEVLVKPSEPILNQLLQIYENSKWIDK